jgi:DNA-binding CsgD family transcriptional regulator
MQDKEAVFLIPSSIFSDRRLSFTESIVDSLWCEMHLGQSDIARLLGIDRRNVHTLLKRAALKKPEPSIKVTESNIFIPITVFQQRAGPSLEALVLYLKGLGLKNKDIARILARSEKTVWTAISRGERR